MATMVVHDRTASGKSVGSIELLDLPDRFTLRDLIRTRVREEVARYNLRPTAIFAGFVQPDGATQTAGGFSMSAPRRIDWERQAQIAIKAFGRNGFFVIVDGKQMTELDEEIALTGPSDIGFIKLTPLVGG
jgi:hypothetical protein